MTGNDDQKFFQQFLGMEVLCVSGQDQTPLCTRPFMGLMSYNVCWYHTPSPTPPFFANSRTIFTVLSYSSLFRSGFAASR